MQRAQRLALHFRPGTLLKSVQPTPRIMPSGDNDPNYLAMIRELPCLHCGMEPSEAAHVRMASAAHGKASGIGKRPADRWSVPLCAEHHRLARDAQHQRGEREFWDALDVNPLWVAERLYARRGDLVAMRAVVLTAIAERRI